MSRSLTVQVGGRPLTLLAERAAWLQDERTLLVADAHLGKAQSFRRLGVPVPGGTTAANLARLGALIDRLAAREVLFLGDLLHARSGRSPRVMTAVADWRAHHAGVAMRLVRGNHDRHAGDPPKEWQIDVVDEPWFIGPLALCHHPKPVDGAYVLAGHLHPGAVVGQGLDRMRLPCFHFGPDLGVLPAFGDFTGLHVVRRGPEDRCFVVADDEVRPLP